MQPVWTKPRKAIPIVEEEVVVFAREVHRLSPFTIRGRAKPTSLSSEPPLYVRDVRVDEASGGTTLGQGAVSTAAKVPTGPYTMSSGSRPFQHASGTAAMRKMAHIMLILPVMLMPPQHWASSSTVASASCHPYRRNRPRESPILPEYLLAHARKVREEENVSMNQLCVTAIAEKVGVVGPRLAKDLFR